MPDPKERFFPDEGMTPKNATTKKTLNRSDSAELRRLRDRCADDTMDVKRSTVRIPQTEEDVAEMDKRDFIQYVVSTIENARNLILDVLKKSDESEVFIAEWSEKIDIDEENFDIKTISDHVTDRIRSIDTLALLSPSREATKDFAYSKIILQEIQEKLIQRRRSLRKSRY